MTFDAAQRLQTGFALTQGLAQLWIALLQAVAFAQANDMHFRRACRLCMASELAAR